VFFSRVIFRGWGFLSRLQSLKLKPLKDFILTSGFTVQSSMYDVKQQFDKRRFFRTPSNYGYINMDWELMPNVSFSATGTYTGKMLVPYFGPLSDPDVGELRESGSFIDLGSKLQYTIKINGADLRIYTGIKNMFNSYQSDFDIGINRDPSYIYGPINPRTIYFGVSIGNRLTD